MKTLSPQAGRLARRLAEPGIAARRSPFGCGRLALFRTGPNGASLGAGYAPDAEVRELIAHGIARWSEVAGERRLALVASPTGPRVLDTATVEVDGSERTVLIDQRESPLLWLRRRPGRDGRPQISDEQFAAGERFREDLTRAAMLPRTTMNWDAAFAPDGRGPSVRDPASGSDAAVAARQRVRRACDGLGPELSGLAIDVCGFLKGLDRVERERGWPARSGKVVLRVALDQLARHYGLAAQPGGGRRAAPAVWRAADPRPGIPPPA